MICSFIVTYASTYLIIYPSFCYVHQNYYLFCTCSDHDITKQQQQQKVSSPSLSQYFNKDKKQQQQNNSDAVLGKENTSADLKALLPKQKMKFMKLDVSICYVLYFVVFRIGVVSVKSNMMDVC